MLSSIPFVVNEIKLREMAYSDSIYAWLLLHSHYDEAQKHNYIYERDFTFIEIANDIHKNRNTVAKRFKELLALSENGKAAGKALIYYDKSNKCYILPNFKEFQKLDSDTVLNLFWMCGQDNQRKEELVKMYAWLKQQVRVERRKEISFEDMITAFGHSGGNKQIYENYKYILTLLQGAGLIKFRTDFNSLRMKDGKFAKTFYVYQVNDKASQEWIDKKNSN